MFVSEEIKAAYLQTTYRVNGTGKPVDIRIGVQNDALDRLLEACQTKEWVFVTASNPGSRALKESENQQRNAGLKQALMEAGLQFLEGVGVPDAAGWSAEQSYLVFGITKSDGIAIAKRWGQCAIVWGIAGSLPELMWID